MTRNEKRQHWQQIIEQQVESGLSKSAFCQQQAINLATFYYWAKRLSEPADGAPQQALPLLLNDMPESGTAATQHSLMLTLPNGHQLTFPATLAPEQLQQFLRVLSA